MADRASSPPPPPGSPPQTPPSVKRLRDAARGVSHQLTERPTPKNVDAQLDELRRGLRVVKHGRKGKPRDTWLFLDSHDGLCWVRAGKKGEPPSVQKLSTKRRLCLRPDLDLDVVRGKQTAPLKRNKKAPHYMCLSVVVASHDHNTARERAAFERRPRPTPSRPPWTAPAGVLAAQAGRAKVRAVLRRARLREHTRRGRLALRRAGHADDLDRGRWLRPEHKSMRMRTSRARTFSSETRLLPPPSNVTVATSSKSSSWPTLTVTCRTDGPTSSERDERRVGDGRRASADWGKRPVVAQNFWPSNMAVAGWRPSWHDAPMSRTATRRAGLDGGLAGGESAAAGACRESQGSRSVDIVGLRGSVDIVGLSGGGALVAVGARSAAPNRRGL